ncbi:MAG TPA: cobalamin-dependent protein [Polyangiales bacterium]
MQLAVQEADRIAARAHQLARHAVYLQDEVWASSGAPREPHEQQLSAATQHLRSLSDAMLGQSEQLFVDYVEWAQTSLTARHVAPETLTSQLTLLQRVLNDELPEAAQAAETFLAAALARLAEGPAEVVSHVTEGSLAARFLERLLAYDRSGALSLVNAALDGGVSVREVYLEVIQRVQHEIGRLWQLNHLSIAHEHYCTAVSQLVLAQLYPRLMHASGGEPMVATCVADELHELGARMVADFFEMDGWDTTYVGANAPAQDLLHVLRSRKAGLLAVSATMGCHVHAALALIRQVRDARDLRHVKILVGGRPFVVAGALWKRIGADACARDAEQAVREGRALLGLD